MSKSACKTPTITLTTTSPYMVSDVPTLLDEDGRALSIKAVSSLCRCGHSDDKPYCDGSHAEHGIAGSKYPERAPDRVKHYHGEHITIVDNRGVCSHDKSCVLGLPAVFREHQRPWIAPDMATPEEIIAVIERCPSGALAYVLAGELHDSLPREPAILCQRDGPYAVVGGICLRDDQASVPQCAEHYTLCRCGRSLNQPFCDGTHLLDSHSLAPAAGARTSAAPDSRDT